MVWTALRPEAMISTDPDISGGLNDGLLSGDFAATNLGMAGGQVKDTYDPDNGRM